MKLCKDCKFYQPFQHAEFPGQYAKCAYPLRDEATMLVAGEGKVTRLCEYERRYSRVDIFILRSDHCGREGRWWTPA